MGKKKAKTDEQDNLIIKPTSDLFTAVLWSAPKNEPILRDFINAVLGDIGWPPITKATVKNRFNIKEFAVDKAIVLDVQVEDENKRKFDIEVQIASHSAFPNRVLHYWSDLYSAQLRVGGDYTELRPVTSIIITEFAIFPALKNVHNVFHLTAMEDPSFVLTDDLQIHFLRLSDLLKGRWEALQNLHQKLKHWVNFFVFGATKTEEEMSQLVENDPIIREAYQELQRFSSNPEMREKERQRQRFLADYNLSIGAATKDGKIESKIEDIILVLEDRFGQIPEGILTSLNVKTDLSVLRSLLLHASKCATLDEFADAMK